MLWCPPSSLPPPGGDIRNHLARPGATTTKLDQDCFNLRHGVVERGEGARHHRDVHDVPEITHISSGVQDEALIENLQKMLEITSWPAVSQTSAILAS